jgi:DNA polymerase-3 subunit epsilon
MKDRILWFDLETTGTDPEKNGIIQIAAVIEQEGEIIDTFNTLMNPVGKLIDDAALIVNGHTRNLLSMYRCPEAVYREFNAFLDKYGKRGDKKARYIPGGYNARFDLDFLSQFFFDMSKGPFAFWEHLQYNPVDPFPVVVWLWRQGFLKLPDCKLSTVAEYFKIEITAHDALSDVLAARSVSIELKKAFFK